MRPIWWNCDSLGKSRSLLQLIILPADVRHSRFPCILWIRCFRRHYELDKNEPPPEIEWSLFMVVRGEWCLFERRLVWCELSIYLTPQIGPLLSLLSRPYKTNSFPTLLTWSTGGVRVKGNKHYYISESKLDSSTNFGSTNWSSRCELNWFGFAPNERSEGRKKEREGESSF